MNPALKKPRRTPRPHAQIHLPPLDSHQALLLVDLLERTSRALWRAYGDAMADRLAAIGAETGPPVPEVYTDVPEHTDDDAHPTDDPDDHDF